MMLVLYYRLNSELLIDLLICTFPERKQKHFIKLKVLIIELTFSTLTNFVWTFFIAPRSIYNTLTSDVAAWTLIISQRYHSHDSSSYTQQNLPGMKF
jgi:hypothetical protein